LNYFSIIFFLIHFQAEAGKIMELCSNVFSWLPLATVIGEKILVAHGGISDRTDIERIKRVRRNQVILLPFPPIPNLPE